MRSSYAKNEANLNGNGAGFFRPLRIAQVAPLYESVPPKLYGGTERVVSFLSEELVRQGHQVTLFASGDSVTSARLKHCSSVSLRLANLNRLGPGYQVIQIADLMDERESYDVIHSHLDYWLFPFCGLIDTPIVATQHSRLDIPELHRIYLRFAAAPIVSISDAQRRPLPGLNWQATVYHGLPRDLLHFHPGPGKYLAFLGRISPEKQPDLAIQVANAAGLPLKIAAKVDNADKEYFECLIRPMIESSPLVEYIGEIRDAEKDEFLGNAAALLFPVNWPEPFGLVMIEALACGTPVIARPCGSVPEVIRSGVTGFVESGFDQLLAAVKKVDTLSRQACRQEFEARFTSEVMASNYLRVYQRLIAKSEVGTDKNGRSEEVSL